ncbi:MAG: hypothetical protein SFZ24_06605 [Planctomycetota bacterium]|nr:hypothetical protein [Planctomycetota bacterium]
MDALPPSAIVWLTRPQGPLIGLAARRAGVRLVGVGAESPLTDPIPFADDAERFTDLRLAVTTTEARTLLLAAPPPRGPESDDAELLRLARSRNMSILSLEPFPGSLTAAALAEAAAWAESVRVIPLFCEHEAMQGLPDVLESFGPPRTVSVSFRSGRACSGLGARLFDAMHLVHTTLGMPESIDACVITEVSASGLRLEPAESLRHLHGDLTANLRYSGARAAAISLSDRGGRWFRGALALGEGGCLRLDETGVERIGPEGETIESRPEPGRPVDAVLEHVDPLALRSLAGALERAHDPRRARAAPPDPAPVLAMCEAALLSARTGQPESPATMERMVRP